MNTPTQEILSKAYDLLVIGSGAGGMATAITARLEGLTVLVIEKEPRIGGSTARSGGNIWVPCNHLAVAEGIEDSLQRADEYIRAEAGQFYDAARTRAYLEQAPIMARTLEQHTSALRFIRTDAVGDNHPQLPGAAESGRTLTTPPFDASTLGRRLRDLANPLPELTFLGMQIQPGRELAHFFKAFTSLSSFAFVLRRLSAHAADILRHGRTTRLANGNGLAARLFKSAIDLDVAIVTETRAVSLSENAGAVLGVRVEADGRSFDLRAQRAVVLASGGFPHDEARRTHLAPIGVLGAGAYSLAPQGNTGDGVRLGESVGGQIEDRLPNTISWTPVSRVPRPDGGHGHFPHGFDRNKPGVVAVTRGGRRFVNEGVVGNDFIRAMAKACDADDVEGFFIVDHRTIRRYGFGIVRPAPAPLHHHIRSGYLVRGNTLEELAHKAGIDAQQLVKTIDRFNADCARGADSEFARGGTSFERRSGDASVKPNPCLAPVRDAPFYAVQILPGDFSTLSGLRVDEHARVLDVHGAAIAGLYAVGNDALSMFGGNSPAGGATLGPALTLGFIAARHIAAATSATTSDGDPQRISERTE